MDDSFRARVASSNTSDVFDIICKKNTDPLDPDTQHGLHLGNRCLLGKMGAQELCVHRPSTGQSAGSK
jgi:hypothetical protein